MLLYSVEETKTRRYGEMEVFHDPPIYTVVPEALEVTCHLPTPDVQSFLELRTVHTGTLLHYVMHMGIGGSTQALKLP